jgi:methionine-rich copper-binding protein CopC
MNRRPAALLAGMALAALPIAAVAHSELDKSDPANGANLQTAPSAVVLTFTEELNPAASSFTVTGAGGAAVGSGEVDLDVAARNVLRGTVSISQPGTYRIEWTSLSLDGDTLHGTVTFGYRLSSPPDTSTRHRQGADLLPLTAAGMVLLVVAGMLAERRALPR